MLSHRDLFEQLETGFLKAMPIHIALKPIPPVFMMISYRYSDDGNLTENDSRSPDGACGIREWIIQPGFHYVLSRLLTSAFVGRISVA